MSKIRVRIAPSPTWNMHIGTARAALFNYLYAKPKWGKFLIRIEDTDKERSLPEHTEEILAWLSWLWLNPDEEIVYQSQNEEKHRKIIQQLIDEWKAYYAWETSEELQEMREQARKEKKWFVYKTPSYTDEQIQQFKKEWRKPVVRFKVEEKELVFNDMVKWEIKTDTSTIWDFVIAKSYGSPIFYLANVVDDNLMWITHVIRWEDHIPNTPKQILLYEALDYQVPVFWHLPLLLNSNKSKMSKRDTPETFVTVKKFAQAWFLSEAVLNFIALMGWHTSDDREFFTFNELLKEFSMDRVQSSNAVYDFPRAIHFNAEHIRNLTADQFVEQLKNYVDLLLNNESLKLDFQEDKELYEKAKYWDNLIKEWKLDNLDYVNKWFDEIKVRLQTLEQFVLYAEYLYKFVPVSDDILYNAKMKVTKELVQEHLPKLIDLLENVETWNEENLKETLINYNKENWLKNGQTLRPIRSVLSWVQASPWAFELLLILWKEESLDRLRRFGD